MVFTGAERVLSFTLDAGRITEIDVVRNPEKLSTLAGTPVRLNWPRETE